MATPKVPLAEFIAELSDPNISVRRLAIKKIMRRRQERGQAFEHLTRLLNDSDYQVRRATIQALGRLGDTRALPYLVSGLNDRAFRIRLLSVRSLVMLGDVRAIPHLAKALDDVSASVRRAALGALLELDSNGGQTIPYILRALSDHADPVRVSALGALLKQSGVQAIPHLVTALTDSSEIMRKLANGYLTQMGYTNPQVVLALLPLTTHPASVTREAVFAILRRLGDPRSFAALVQGLRDPEFRIRLNAAFTLGYLGDPQAVEPLLAARDDTEGLVRVRIAEALGKLKDQRGFDSLLLLVCDPDKVVCAYAAWALGELNDPRAIPALVACLTREHDALLRVAAIKALCVLIVKFPAEVAVSGVIEQLLCCFGDSDLHIRDAVNSVLMAPACKPLLLKPLLQVLASKASTSQMLVAALRVLELSHFAMELQMLETLRTLLEQEGVYTPARAKAISLLGKNGDGSAVEPLLKLLESTDISLCEAASEALGLLGDARALEPLRALLARTAPGYLSVLVKEAIARILSTEKRLLA